MTGCTSCGGFGGHHDDQVHGTGDYAAFGFDADGFAPKTCDDCDGTGKRYNHPLASMPGTCTLCAGQGEVGTWDGGWSK